MGVVLSDLKCDYCLEIRETVKDPIARRGEKCRICEDCLRAYRENDKVRIRALRLIRVAAKRVETYRYDNETHTKVCYSCHIRKDKSKFGIARNKLDGLNGACKECCRLKKQEIEIRVGRDLILQYHQAYANSPGNKERIRDNCKRLQQFYCDNLTDTYVRNVIKKKFRARGVKIADAAITKDVIELHRVNIQLKREGRKL